MAKNIQHINAVLTCNENGKILTANKDSELLFKLTNHELLGVLLSDIIQLQSVVNIPQHLAAVNDAAKMNACGKAILAKNIDHSINFELLAWCIETDSDSNNINTHSRHTYLCHLNILPNIQTQAITKSSKISLVEIIDNLQRNSISEYGAHYVFGQALDALLNYTNSEYGFIGEILNNADNVPYLQTHAITNISWNAATEDFFQNSAPSGLSFFNNNTLFGQTVTKGEVVIANQPKEHPKSGGLPEGHPPLNHYLGLPIYCNNELVGMAGISNRPGGYNQEIVDDLTFLMNFLGFLIKSYQKDRERKFFESKIQIQSKELNEANNLLRAVNESNLDLQFTLDMDGTITNYHAHNKNDLYLAPEKFFGKKMHEILPKNVAVQFRKAFDEVLSSNTLVSFNYMLLMPKGECTFNARVVSLEDNKVVVTVRDITEHMKMEAEILKVRKLESIGVLAGGIAHDFNNILSGLFGNIELAKMKLTKEHAAYHNIQIAIQAFDRATQLTQQLLTFAKGGTPQLEAASMKQIIRESIDLNLSGSNVRSVLNLSDNLWQVNVDKGQISQVISNLTINAKQSMPNGGTLTIDAENVKDIKSNARKNLSGDYLKITIMDEGVGITHKNIEQIFDPYFTTKQSGSGLGLATVHSIITKHNGHISLESQVGKGTTFTIYLPADKNFLDLADTTQTCIVGESKFCSGHLLVMDDDEAVRELLSDMLESYGYTVDLAADGKEALNKYLTASKNNNSFDVVIMDLTIPGGMGGKEAIAKFTEMDPQVKVIVSSGYSTDPIMANYDDYGFSGRLAKPFKLADMGKEISRVMALRDR